MNTAPDRLKEQWRSASACRGRARTALRGNWVNAILVGALSAAIRMTGPGSPWLRIDFAKEHPIWVSIPDNLGSLLDKVFGVPLPVIRFLCGVMLAAGLILHGAILLGQARYNLDLIDGKPARLSELFSGLGRIPTALVMHLLRSVLIYVGMRLFLLPGYVLEYGWAFAPHILAEDPDCGGQEALRRSWALMRGHKLELCFLELSFLVWTLLSARTRGIGDLFLTPYKDAARADFYRKLTAQQEPQ